MKIRYWFWSYVLVFIQRLTDRTILVVTLQEGECEGCHSLTGLPKFLCLASNCTASLCLPDAVSCFFILIGRPVLPLHVDDEDVIRLSLCTPW